MFAAARRFKPMLLPPMRWGIRFVPVSWKFRRIAGGFQARRWYKRVLRAGV